MKAEVRNEHVAEVRRGLYPSDVTSQIGSRLTGNLGCIVALTIGLAVVGLVSFLTGAITNLEEEWGVLIFMTLMVAAPFSILARAHEGGRAAWLTALALTVMFWGLACVDAFARRGEGANIGMAFLMLVSPLPITVGAFAAGAAAKRRP